ncbi:MAG: N-acetyltransferase [Cyclobacteriaceae bacterium]
MNQTPAGITKLLHSNIEIATQIYHVFQVSYQVEADLVGTNNFPPLKRSVQDIIRSDTDFYGYLSEGVLSAVVELELKESHLHICSLVVHPDYFRRGIGRQLVYFALDSMNPETATVETASVNEPAISLYKRAGFSEERKYMTEVGIEKIRLFKG